VERTGRPTRASVSQYVIRLLSSVKGNARVRRKTVYAMQPMFLSVEWTGILTLTNVLQDARGLKLIVKEGVRARKSVRARIL